MTARILVVDDEPLFCQVIEQFFRKQIKSNKYKFYFAANGKEALDKLHSNSEIDLLLTDIRMPEMDGLTLIHQINKERIAVKSVVISAYTDVLNFRKAMKEGAFDFLPKPVELSELEETIDRVLHEQNIKVPSLTPTLIRQEDSQASTLRQTTKKINLNSILQLAKKLPLSQQLGVVSKLIENFSLEEIEELRDKVEAQAYIEANYETEKQENRDSLAFKLYDQLGLSEEEVPIVALEEGFIEERVVKKKLASGEIKDYGIHLYLRWWNEGKRRSYYIGSKDSCDETARVLLSVLNYKERKRSPAKTSQLNNSEVQLSQTCSESVEISQPLTTKSKPPIKLYGSNFEKVSGSNKQTMK